LELK